MNLQMIIDESKLEATKAKTLLGQFQNFFELADEWTVSAKTLVVSSDNDIETMATANKALVKVKEKLKEVENVRKKLKEESLREGQSIDSIARILKNLLSPIIVHLDQQANYTKYKIEAEQKRAEEEHVKMLQRKEEERLEQELAERKRIEEDNKKMRIELEQKKVEEEKLKRLQRQAEQRLEEEEKKRKQVEDENKKLQEKLIVVEQKEQKEILQNNTKICITCKRPL